MNKLLSWSLERMQERSTWLGLISLFTAIGFTLTPELQEVIIALGLSSGALIAIITKDHQK